MIIFDTESTNSYLVHVKKLRKIHPLFLMNLNEMEHITLNDMIIFLISLLSKNYHSCLGVCIMIRLSANYHLTKMTSSVFVIGR